MNNNGNNILLSRIQRLFEEINEIRLFRRIFGWSKFLKEFFEGAKEDLTRLDIIEENSAKKEKEIKESLENLADLKSKLEREKESNVVLQERIKILNDSNVKQNQQIEGLKESVRTLEATNQAQQEKVVELNKANTKLVEQDEQRKKEQDEQIKILSESSETAKKTREQLIEDDKKLKEEKELNRSRIWKEHQDKTVTLILGLCQRSEYAFKSYDDRNPPTELSDVNLKPDVCLEFFDEYIIFDAKTPNSPNSNLEEYLKNQVKDSAKKYNKAAKYIHKSVFFIIPSEEVARIKTAVYVENNYRFHIIPPEAIEPILANYKKIEGYEIAEKLNPEDREELINLIARYDNHIMRRNQIDLFLIDHGFKTIGSKVNLPSGFREALAEKQSIEIINPPTQNRKRKISLENSEREHQQLIEEAKIKSLPPLKEIEYQEKE